MKSWSFSGRGEWDRRGAMHRPYIYNNFFLVTIAYKVVPSSRLMSHFVNSEVIL